MRAAPQIVLSAEQRETLTRWSRGRRTPSRLVLRAKVVLLAAEGAQNKDIAGRLSMTRPTVGLWRTRFVQNGIAGIEKDAPRGGRPASRRKEAEARIVSTTTQQRPANATHWSVRSLAEHLHLDRSLVHRVWRANGLKPHLIRTFKVSNDPHFLEKLHDAHYAHRDHWDRFIVITPIGAS